jgi:predicted restriction endonuclease
VPELERSFNLWPRDGVAFVAATDADLAQWLNRASTLAHSLPNQAVVDFDTEVQSALAALSTSDILNTEVHRLVRQRVGQDRYRQAMLAYWGSACAVTGVTLAPALRASHAKPWAECVSDSERLDMFNGFLLSANLDALFDKFLITFSDAGKILISSKVSEHDRQALGLNESMSLRWVASEHLVYLKHHQNEFSKED